MNTVSGLLFVGAAVACVVGRTIVGAVLLIIAGAGGTAVAWDRWSARAGEQVHVSALFSAVTPSSEELILVATHLPMLILGLILLAFSVAPGE